MTLKIVATALCILLICNVFAQPISRKEKEAILTNVKNLFTKHYHFKGQVRSTVDYLDKQWKSGRYNSLNTVSLFTAAISEDLKKIAHDEHLNFFHHAAEIAKKESSAHAIPWGLLNEKFLNNGLTGLEVLQGDVGYMRLQAFGSFDDIAPGAFTFLNNTRALIIDLRGNGGGMLSNLVISYLLPEDSIHLNTIYWNDHTDSIFTYRKLNGPRYLNKPVYVLTDKVTFSSAEEFAYDLQNLKRATIIGETTGGGANPGGLMPVYTFPDGSRLDIYISLAHVENPISKTNWEGKGVQPDIAVDPKDALQKAHVLALEYLEQHEENSFIKKQFTEIKSKIQTSAE